MKKANADHPTHTKIKKQVRLRQSEQCDNKRTGLYVLLVIEKLYLFACIQILPGKYGSSWKFFFFNLRISITLKLMKVTLFSISKSLLDASIIENKLKLYLFGKVSVSSSTR